MGKERIYRKNKKRKMDTHIIERGGGMNEKIRVSIKSYSELWEIILVMITIVGTIWLVVALSYFSVVSWVLFLVFVSISVFWIVLQERKIEVVADIKSVRWKRFIILHEIKLDDITGLKCEPYEMRSRYATYQRLRLIIELKTDIGSVELNDFIETSDLLDEKINGTKSDIELLKLYEFLKEHCRENLEKNSEIDIEI